MFSSLKTPAYQNVRNFATLKEISLRLKSVKNISKITSSMKMIAASRFSKAEKELKPARAYGQSATAFYDNLDASAEVTGKPTKLLVGISSDRGLCGGIHSGISKAIKADIAQNPDYNYKLVLVGDKIRTILQRSYANNIALSFNNVGRTMPSFMDAGVIASEILKLGIPFELGAIYFNRFKSVVSYESISTPVLSTDTVSAAPNISFYDSVDSPILEAYQEYQLANLIFFALKEGSCSEHSSRMTAMDNATKNAGEMIDKLTLSFNRTRQAVITTELIEIMSGATAMEEKN